jgi:5-methylcytosine-specific restriction endonuclease McrA
MIDRFGCEQGGELAEIVNLDALIAREDFIAPIDNIGSPGEGGKASASATDLRRAESFFETLRKPDFQRETAAWSPTTVCDFIEAFVSNDLIPSVICWQSPARLTFIIDGAHRLSAIIAWLEDDYGAGKRSVEFYGKIPEEQERIHDKTRELVKRRVGSYVEWRSETANPGSFPELIAKVRGLAHAKVPLLWVPGSDATKAEKAFFTINQSAVEIDATELKILNARSKPNAVTARTIVRNATGTKYWESFTKDGQKEIVADGKSVYAALYIPPLQTPPRTEELPVAGHGYGSQTLPLIFDLVNIANKFPVEDASKNKKKYLVPQGHAKPEEGPTLETMRATLRLVSRVTTTHPSSLGLHPAVYFYAINYRHQPTAVLAVLQFIQDMADIDEFLEFTRHRGKFEEFLVNHKLFINQLTLKHGSMVKGFLPIRDYYRFVFDRVKAGRNEREIESDLSSNEKYQTLVKEKPIKSKKPKAFSQDAKNVKLMSDVLASAFVCNLCGARIDKKSMHLDHILDKSKGGLGNLDNSQWLHPYCDSTAKQHLNAG